MMNGSDCARRGALFSSVVHSCKASRNGLRAIPDSSAAQALAESVPNARGSITGLTRGSTLAHIARAALESIAFQNAALLQAMSRDAVQE
jgi:glycerol kinase